MNFANGIFLEGYLVNQIKTWRECYAQSNKDSYEGAFWLDKREGEGIIHYCSGGRYEGYWKMTLKMEKTYFSKTKGQ